MSIVAVYRFYLTQLLELRWRAWMTRDYLQRWLNGHVFYQVELQSQHSTDNPDQRIQEDVQQFTADTVGLSLGLLDASVTLLSFIGILWSLSGSFAFTLQELLNRFTSLFHGGLGSQAVEPCPHLGFGTRGVQVARFGM